LFFFRFLLFSFNDPSPPPIYTLSLHDALPIYGATLEHHPLHVVEHLILIATALVAWWPVLSPSILLPRLHYGTQILYLFAFGIRSEEHTSELQSRFDLVCRLLLEKKKKTKKNI